MLIIIIALGVVLGLIIFTKPRAAIIVVLLFLAVVIGGTMTSNTAPPSTTCSTLEKAFGKNCTIEGSVK